MHHLQFYQGLSRIFTDTVSVVLAWSLAYYIRPWTDLIPNIQYHFPLENLPALDFFIPFVGFSAMGLGVIFASLSLYSYPARYFTFEIFQKILWGIILWVLCIVAVYALLFHELIFSRIMLFHTAFFTLCFTLGFRLILYWVWVRIFPLTKNIAVFGTPEEYNLFQKAFAHKSYRTQFCDMTGFTLEKAHKLIQNTSEIFFFEAEKSTKFLPQMRELTAEKGKTLHIIPWYAKGFWGHGEFHVEKGIPLLTTLPIRKDLWWFAVKRMMDIGISLLVILCFLPIWLVIAGIIWCYDFGNPFYISTRVGRNGKLFSVIKFRSMRTNADQEKKKLMMQSHRDGPFFKMKNDPRVTPIGRFLRKTSLDEIPQFFNVLKGEMSVVGPRPHLPEEVEQYTSAQRQILSAKPGISGLAQVSGRSDLSFEKELFLDIYYAENQSFFMDCTIICKTPFVLLGGKGAD